jgi:hypothetical protein
LHEEIKKGDKKGRRMVISSKESDTGRGANVDISE